jgi:hypothetical protein
MADDDIVEFFGQRMTRDWAEMLRASQDESHVVMDGVSYARVPYGSETFRQPVEAEHGPCRHCNTLKGKLHEFNCDYEQCPRCGWQLMSCDCEFVGHEWRNDEDDRVE